MTIAVASLAVMAGTGVVVWLHIKFGREDYREARADKRSPSAVLARGQLGTLLGAGAPLIQLLLDSPSWLVVTVLVAEIVIFGMISVRQRRAKGQS